jgi:hypothetical protein
MPISLAAQRVELVSPLRGPHTGEEELHLILWAAWGPIGVSVPRDEYETYAPRLASILRNGATPEDIAAALGEWRTESMGLPPEPDSDLTVALKFADWYENPFFGTGYPTPSEFTSYCVGERRVASVRECDPAVHGFGCPVE